jgi:hypothetical protein
MGQKSLVFLFNITCLLLLAWVVRPPSCPAAAIENIETQELDQQKKNTQAEKTYSGTQGKNTPLKK